MYKKMVLTSRETSR